MRTFCKLTLLLTFVILSYSSCRKDERVPIINLKGRCLIASDTTKLTGNNGYSVYEFQPNSNRLKMAKRIVGNGNLLLYRDVYYLSGDMPDKTVTYINANEFYETRFEYKNGSILPYKSELFYSNKLNSPVTKYVRGFNFSYDSKNKLKEVAFVTPKNRDQEYTLHISYNDKENVTKLEYEMKGNSRLPNAVITIQSFDDKPNPYSAIPYWEFLLLNAEWDSNDPEPIISALSKNNPLDYSIGNFKREMSYVYNQNGLPVKRVNTNKSQNTQNSFAESFTYRCE